MSNALDDTIPGRLHPVHSVPSEAHRSFDRPPGLDEMERRHRSELDAAVCVARVEGRVDAVERWRSEHASEHRSITRTLAIGAGLGVAGIWVIAAELGLRMYGLIGK